MASSSEELNRLEDQIFESSDLKITMVLRTRVLRLRTDDSDPYSKWALELLNQKQYRKAKQKFKRSIQISQSHCDPYDEWVVGLYYSREFEEIIMVLEKHYKKLRYPYYGQNNMGMCFLHLGDYENAIKHFQKASSMEDNFKLPYFNWALALYLQGKKEEALEMYKRTCENSNLPLWVYAREVKMLKEDLERDENKIFEDLIKTKLEGVEYFIEMAERKKRGD